MNSLNSPIGIFDSGIGGMTLLNQALYMMPDEDYIFYADTDHVPYGTKSKEQVIGYVDDILAFMVDRGCKAVVIACNTATSAAASIVRAKYDIPIIGIEPAIKPAVEKSEGRRVLVVATPLTVKEKKLKDLVDRVDDAHLVDLLPLPGLVNFAEGGEFTSSRVTDYLRDELSPYDLSQYGELVLGCTHFNYFKDTFRSLIPKDMQIIDGSEGTIRQLGRVLEARGELADTSCHDTDSKDIDKTRDKIRFFMSGREVTDEAELARLRGLLSRLDSMRVLG